MRELHVDNRVVPKARPRGTAVGPGALVLGYLRSVEADGSGGGDLQWPLPEEVPAGAMAYNRNFRKKFRPTRSCEEATCAALSSLHVLRPAHTRVLG